MDISSLLALTHNATLLLAMVFIYDLTSRYRVGDQGFWPGVPIGIALGVITIVIMLTPWIYKPGINFDTRTVLLGVSGLFFGPIPTRSEEHTSELQSRENLVCRHQLEKKKRHFNEATIIELIHAIYQDRKITS